MRDIAVYGAGGFGKEVVCLINQINEFFPESDSWNFIGYFDDNKDKGTQAEYGKVLGSVDELNSWPSPLAIAISIAQPENVKTLSERIINPLISYPNLIAPDVIFYDRDSVIFGKGNIVCSSCLISCDVSIGNFNIFNNFVTIGHDDIIGNFNSIMPAVRLSGNVTIGDCNFLGVSSIILQSFRIGNHTTIGAGSVIMRKTKDGCTYVGNPATKIEY